MTRPDREYQECQVVTVAGRWMWQCTLPAGHAGEHVATNARETNADRLVGDEVYARWSEPSSSPRHDIKRRLSNRTPGEWWLSQDDGPPTVIRMVESNSEEVLATLKYVCDADLIAHVPADLAYLLAENERLQDQLKVYEDVLMSVRQFARAEAPGPGAPIASLPCGDPMVSEELSRLLEPAFSYARLTRPGTTSVPEQPSRG
jgi:hypothetical protein